MDKFKAPKDKLVCLLNACNLLLGLLKAASDVRGNNASGGNSFGADEFLPLLIYTVIQAKPLNCVANLEYIAAFRHPSKFDASSRYYHSSMVGAVAYIESIGAEDLKMDQAEFDARMADVRTERKVNGRALQPSTSGQQQPELGVKEWETLAAKLRADHEANLQMLADLQQSQSSEASSVADKLAALTQERDEQRAKVMEMEAQLRQLQSEHSAQVSSMADTHAAHVAVLQLEISKLKSDQASLA
jgi:hypothetical protein